MITFLLASLFALCATSEAKMLHDYEANVRLPGTSRASGWSCHTSLVQKVQESQRNHRGELKDITWDSSVKTEYNTQSGKELAFKINPHVNQYHPRARLYAEVSEECSQDYTTTNDEGKTVTATRNASLKWRCEIRGLSMPQTVGESRTYGCRKDGRADAWNISGHYDDQIAKNMITKRSRNLDIDLKLNKIDKIFKDYFGSCNGKSDDQAIQLNLDQGVQGRMMENAFHFYISIDGGQELDLKRSSGLLSDDIKYCPPTPNSPVNVKVRIVKKGWIWDAKYTSDAADLDKPNSSAELKHTRQTLFGNPGFQSTIAIQRKPFLEQPHDTLPKTPSGGATSSW